MFRESMTKRYSSNVLNNWKDRAYSLLRGCPTFDPVQRFWGDSHVRHVHANSLLVYHNFSSKSWLIFSWLIYLFVTYLFENSLLVHVVIETSANWSKFETNNFNLKIEKQTRLALNPKGYIVILTFKSQTIHCNFDFTNVNQSICWI